MDGVRPAVGVMSRFGDVVGERILFLRKRAILEFWFRFVVYRACAQIKMLSTARIVDVPTNDVNCLCCLLLLLCSSMFLNYKNWFKKEAVCW